MKRYRLPITFFSLLLLPVTISWAAAPLVQNMTITDVTPVSFSVIWVSDQPSSCDIAVFSDANGANDITATLAITPHPMHTGDATLVNAAQPRGVMKIQVSGLKNATRYYFRTKTTSIPSGDETLSPLNGPYPSVTTEMATVKTAGFETHYRAFTNHVIHQDVFENNGTTPATGALLLATVEGSSYPLSNFVGDGLAGAGTAIDLNNLYSATSRENMLLKGGEKIVVTRYYDYNTTNESAFVVPRNDNLLSLKPPHGLAEAILILQAMTAPVNGPDLSAIADIAEDNRIGIEECLHIIRVVAQLP